jgi:hypothetical protein
MKLARTTVWLAIFAIGTSGAVAQDAAHDVNKATVKAGHAIRHTAGAVGKDATKDAERAGHGTKVAANACAKDTAKGVKTATVKSGTAIKDVAEK